MKGSRHLFFAMIIGMLSFVACKKRPPIIESQEVTVKLGITHEGIEITEEPLQGKASGNDLYAVQVYQKNGGSYERYAYGVFDDPSMMTLTLTSGKQYKFEATTVVGGVAQISKELITGAYRQPFTTMGTGGGNSVASNQFTLSTTRYLNYVGKGYTTLVSGATYKSYYHPTTDRYYGMIQDYTPTSGNTPSIVLKRVVFGVKFVVEGLTEGSLEIVLDKAPVITFISGGATERTELFTFENSTGDESWTGDTYSETIPMSIIWTKGNGVTTETIRAATDPNPFSFTRKKLYTIRIPVTSADAGQNLILSKESETLTPTDEIVINR